MGRDKLYQQQITRTIYGERRLVTLLARTDQRYCILQVQTLALKNVRHQRANTHHHFIQSKAGSRQAVDTKLR